MHVGFRLWNLSGRFDWLADVVHEHQDVGDSRVHLLLSQVHPTQEHVVFDARRVQKCD